MSRLLILAIGAEAFFRTKPNFVCPSEHELSSVPDNCPSRPKYDAIYNSSITAVTPPRHPGPSEQMHAIRDVLLASIQTKKKFAISPFTTHKHDTLSNRIDVPFGLRIDTATLCQYISLAKQQIGNIDTIVYMYKNKNLEGYIHRGTDAYLNDYSNLTMTKKTKSFNMKPFVSKLLPHEKADDVGQFFIENKIGYDNGGKIVLAHAVDWIYGDLSKPIDEGGVYRGNNKDSSRGGLSDVPEMSYEEAKDLNIDLDLLKDVYRMTPHARFIQDLAKDFMVKFKMTGEFTGLHFRFNYGDFFGSEEEMTFGTSGRKLHTDVFANLLVVLKEPLYLLDRLTAYIDKNMPKAKKLIFLTSPYNIAEKMSEILQKQGGTHNGYRFITTLDTAKFLEDYRNCEVVDSWYGEVLSQMEKELMIYSKMFLRARPSNWSFNVQSHRFVKYDSLPYDRVMTDVFKVDDEIPSVEELKKLPYVKPEWFTETVTDETDTTDAL